MWEGVSLLCTGEIRDQGCIIVKFQLRESVMILLLTKLTLNIIHISHSSRQLGTGAVWPGPHNSDLRDSHEYIQVWVELIFKRQIIADCLTWQKLGRLKLLAISALIPLTLHIRKQFVHTLKSLKSESCQASVDNCSDTVKTEIASYGWC